jgi:uncharacterized protein YndB with AHSA1/START domain
MIKPTLVLTWVFPAPPQRVFDVFTQSAHLNAWFGTGVQIDLQVGGKFTSTDGDKARFIKVAVPRHLVFSYTHTELGIDTEIDVTFSPSGPRNETQVRFVHKGLDPKQISPEKYRWLVDRWNWMADNLKRHLGNQRRLEFEAWQNRTRQVSGTRD